MAAGLSDQAPPMEALAIVVEQRGRRWRSADVFGGKPTAMFKAIRERLRRRAYKHSIREAFRQTIALYSSQDPAAQMEFAQFLAMGWRDFLSDYPNGSYEFASRSKQEQGDYLHTLQAAMNAKLAERESNEAATIGLLAMYLSAIKNSDHALEAEIAAVLDPITRKGWHQSGTAGG